MKWVLLSFISLYRLGVRPFLLGNCRFWPSCSVYAEEAICKHGSIKGGFLTIKRLVRCHPWGGHGVDLVPEVRYPFHKGTSSAEKNKLGK